jgi:hypothetical protein
VRVLEDVFFKGANNETVIWRKGEYEFLGPQEDLLPLTRMPPDLRTISGTNKIGVNLIPEVTMTLHGQARTRDMIDFHVAILRVRPDLAEKLSIGLTNVSPRLANGAAEVDQAIAYMLQAHPDVAHLIKVSGFGETNMFRKEIAEGQVTLAGVGPHTWENIDDFMGKLNDDLPGSLIVAHHDAGKPMEVSIKGNKLRALISGEIDYSDAFRMVEVARRNPNVNVIWAHAGGVSRSGFPGVIHADVIATALEAAPNLYIDMSWGTVAEKVLANNWKTGAWAAPGGRGVMNRFPDRFLYGSDDIGHSISTYHGPLKAYFEGGIIPNLTHPDLFMRGNAARLMDGGAAAFQRYIQNNRARLEKLPLTGDWRLNRMSASDWAWDESFTNPNKP